MKILIFPTDDRLGQASLIHHYNILGHEVFIPKRGSLGLNWTKISSWPGLLCKDPDDLQRNFEKHGYPKDQQDVFGEDCFLFYEDVSLPEIANLPKCKLIDENGLLETKIDAFHTLRGAENQLSQYFNVAKTFFPNAKWISSTMNAYESVIANPKNVARILPANYEFYNYGCNVVNTFCTNIEFDLFGISKIPEKRVQEVSSFNHNFHLRQVNDYQLFTKMNTCIQLTYNNIPQVQNFGVNVRGQGADLRPQYEGQVGSYPTLSPKNCLKKIKTLSGIVHFKQNDWGGGVFFHALHTHTPLITTQRYIQATRSEKYLINDYNCIVINDEIQAAEAVNRLLVNDVLKDRLSSGMKEMQSKIFNESYWNNWKNFLNKLQ
jgi:hypothetical protein